MSKYLIITDTGCDISPELLAEWQIKYVDLLFRFEGEDREYRNVDISIEDFYQRMRDGKNAKTSAANMEDFRTIFIPELAAGNDILYLSFAGCLSNSAQIASITAKELMEEYPDRRIAVVDSRCASAGQGLLVYLSVQKRDSGATFDQTLDYVRETLPKVCHWFTVDDLTYLCRGGRIGTASALAGAVLQIKPVMHVDDEGRLVNVLKVRGRKQSIKSMADRYLRTALDPNGCYFISHGDCIEDAKCLENLIFEKSGQRAALITDIGAVIGAHSGPGTLALFFLGSER